MTNMHNSNTDTSSMIINIKAIKKLSIICVISILSISSFNSLHASNRLLDTIIATVDDTPITLVEFNSRLTPARNVTLEEIKSDPSLAKVLDALILEKLLVAEAERKGIKVTPDDVSRYIDEVKKKNNFSQEQFESALVSEGQSFSKYKERIKVEILKSRVAAASIKNSTAITDDDVTNYIRSKLSGDASQERGQKIHLKKVSLLVSDYTEEQATSLAKELLDKDEPSKFVSDLGSVAENELNPELLNIVKSVQKNSLSKPVQNQGYWDIFQVISRESSEEKISSENIEEEIKKVDKSVREQIKTQLEQEKLQKKMESFIEEELPKLHTVDKRI